MKAHSASLTRSFLFSGAAATAISMTLAAPAVAQDQSDSIRAEEIFVTGSLIARDPNASAPLPVQSVSADDIKMSGQTDLTAVLQRIPALSASTTSQGSVDGAFSSDADSGVGESILNLRGLGIERTLVLVDGRRHVSGLADQQAVDIATIPSALVERVEVLTGGASSLYGADAVSGVVNFILKKDFEGLELDATAGISDQGDGENYRLNGLFGYNFGDGRGNVTFNAYYSRQNDIRFGDRDFTRNNGVADDQPNPDLRFQSGDISATNTPNFSQFFATANGSFSRGALIPSQADFIAGYTDEFGEAPTLSAQEIALFDRASNAPLRSIRSQPTFTISSDRGLIAPADFSSGADTNGNGTGDCLESYVGVNSTFDNAFEDPFGLIGGCWVVNDDGSVRPFQDGTIARLTNGFGGDGSQNNYDDDYLIPDRKEYGAQLNLRYDFTPNITGFIEAKYTRNEVQFGSVLNTFYDLLSIRGDNPFIPAELAGTVDPADDALGLGNAFYVNRDPIDLAPQSEENIRETYRIVGGIEGQFENEWNYELSFNLGRTDNRQNDNNIIQMDRFFAAVDAVEDPSTGQAVCRSDLDPSTISSTTPFDIPLFDFGYYTFAPGDGQCAPLNVLGGPNSSSQAARDFILTSAQNRFELEQISFRAVINGTSEEYFELPAGPIGFAFGAEFRDEKATSTFDALDRGILPVDGIIPGAGGEGGDLIIPAGTNIGDVGAVRQTSLTFDPEQLVRNSGGSYSVWDLFAEVSVPLIADKPFAEELTVGGSMRYSDYTTIGGAVTWGVNANWAPVESLRFRATYSSAVRAPNIFELFAPQQSATFRPDDPCDQTEINALNEAGDARGAIRAANCAADVGTNFTDPLTARFTGATSGNPDLIEETAKTYTIGAVLQPTWLTGLTISVDYWNIEIEDAIESPSSQDIVDACYDGANFPNQFCSLFSRREDNGGLNFLLQQQVNFGRLTTSGVDISGAYNFSIGEVDMTVDTAWSYVNELD